MSVRLVAAAIAAATLLGSIGIAEAQDEWNERQLMLSGGSPRGKSYNALGFTAPDTTRTTVNFAGKEPPGTIIVSTAERKLYLVRDGGSAYQYGVGVGRIGFTWKGTHKITAKKEWPGWTPPAQMRARQKGLPVHMAGGIENPLGARAMYLGSTLYRIHGSNDPETIGQAVSSGCFRMTNDDVKDLYEKVSVGTTVIVR
jgi:lipoprotein-anchoring transpeptidase ErfK/SrfK